MVRSEASSIEAEMQKRMPVPFWTKSGKGRSHAVTAERLTNWFLERARGQEKFPYHLLPAPGLVQLTTVGDGPIRGIGWSGAQLFVVSGDKAYVVDGALAPTEVGEISGSGSVDMAWNGSHMLITTNGQHSYAVNESECISVSIPNLQDATYQDGYAIALQRGTENFHISNSDDLTVWTSTDHTNVDWRPDRLVAIISVHRILWAFGVETTEFYQLTGNSTFPFERIQGSAMEVGCGAHRSVAIADNTVFWLGHDLRVYKAIGAEPVPISTPAIEKEITDQNSPQTAEAFVYTQEGHTFYVLTFGDLTVVYDDTEGVWHHRKSNGVDRWRVHGYVYAWRKHIVADYSTNEIYYLDLSAYDEDGVTRRLEADSAPFSHGGNRAVMWELFVDMEAGVGLDGDQQGDDPKLMMQVSDDYGVTWSNERTASIGQIGEYGVQCRFVGLGQYRQRMVRIAISDPVKAVVTGVYASIEEMGS